MAKRPRKHSKPASNPQRRTLAQSFAQLASFVLGEDLESQETSKVDEAWSRLTSHSRQWHKPAEKDTPEFTLDEALRESGFLEVESVMTITANGGLGVLTLKLRHTGDNAGRWRPTIAQWLPAEWCEGTKVKYRLEIREQFVAVRRLPEPSRFLKVEDKDFSRPSPLSIDESAKQRSGSETLSRETEWLAEFERDYKHLSGAVTLFANAKGMDRSAMSKLLKRARESRVNRA